MSYIDKIFLGWTSEEWTGALDLYICQIVSCHIMCVIILMCWLFDFSLTAVLLTGAALTHSLPHTTHT